jgi:hypothetical protein
MQLRCGVCLSSLFFSALSFFAAALLRSGLAPLRYADPFLNSFAVFGISSASLR